MERRTAAVFRGFMPRPSLKLSPGRHGSQSSARFPRLYAAASLKRARRPGDELAESGFPRLYAAASLKLLVPLIRGGPLVEFSAALCRGLIEAFNLGVWQPHLPVRFPRLYAAASLKQPPAAGGTPDGIEVFRGFMPRPH